MSAAERDDNNRVERKHAGPNEWRKTAVAAANDSAKSLLEVKKRYIWSDRETEHFIRLIIDMGMTNMLDSKR